MQRWRLPSRGCLLVFRRNCPRTLGKLLLEWSLYLRKLVDAPPVSIALSCTTTLSPGARALAMPAIVCVRGGVSTYIQNWQLFVSVGALLGPNLAGMLAAPPPPPPPPLAAHARGSRLDVHTDLAIVCLPGSVSMYIQNWQLFVYVGASRL